MKHFYFVIALVAMCLYSVGQTERLVLVEQFTGEDCGPCASINPGFNQMLRNNTAKAIAIKYQSIVSSSSPNILYNQTKSETGPRDTYYGVTSIPTAVIDGNFKKDNAGNITDNDIDTRFTQSSPFTLTATHDFSANADSIYISVDIEATANYAAAGNTLKLRVAIIETQITLPTPALNGEQVFEGVFRKFYPSPQGTSLTQGWPVGQIQTVALKGVLPAYIFDKSQIRVVAFIQDDQTKEVQQVAASVQKPVNIDSKLKTYLSKFVHCNTTYFEPTVKLQNNGSNTLTNADFNVYLDNTLFTAHSWTGNLATGDSTDVVLPSINASAGKHKITIITTLSNGVTDQNKGNDTLRSEFYFTSGSTTAPVIESFESGIPSQFTVHNPANNTTWASAGYSANGQGAKSVYMRFYTTPAGDVDYLYLPQLDLSVADYARLNFDRSHAQYNAAIQDQCDLEVSTDCGTTWITVWSKKGAKLKTVASAVTSDFKPTGSQWVADTASLDLLAGNPNGLVRFKGLSSYGNNLYLDNFNVEITATSNGGPTGISNIENKLGLNVYPNPTYGKLFVSTEQILENVTVDIYDIRGGIALTQSFNNTNQMQIDTDQLSNGMYVVSVSTNGSVSRTTFVVNR